MLRKGNFHHHTVFEYVFTTLKLENYFYFIKILFI